MKKMIDSKTKSIKDLTNGLLNYADAFSFILREDYEVSKLSETIISDLSIYLKDKKDVQEWPGTKLLLGQAKAYTYYLNEESAFILCQCNDKLYEWVQPELPEDITFYKENKPVFISITHERDAYFILDDKGIDILANQGFF